MITIFINSRGYYIKGNGIEIALSCSPKLDNTGQPFYGEHLQLYAVLAKALNNLRKQQLTEDIMVYNDSRLIDEMNGIVQPLNNLSAEFRNGIRRQILPEIESNVFFRKKNQYAIKQQVDNAKKSLVATPNKLKILDRLATTKIAAIKNKANNALRRLKENWHGK